jgi:hypothetical protein
MIRLKDILIEHGNKENRINLMKLEVLMEKMLPVLAKNNATKLTQICTEIHQMATKLNELPYTLWNAYPEWPVLKVALISKIAEAKEEASKLLESEKVDVLPFVKALDELIAD